MDSPRRSSGAGGEELEEGEGHKPVEVLASSPVDRRVEHSDIQALPRKTRSLASSVEEEQWRAHVRRETLLLKEEFWLEPASQVCVSRRSQEGAWKVAGSWVASLLTLPPLAP